MASLNEAYKAACADIEATLKRELTSTELRMVGLAFGHGAKYGIRETSNNAKRAAGIPLEVA